MSASARSFSFVDQITAVQPGVSVRGRYRIPAALDVFPAALVAEAVGQLAAWAAMVAVGFERRPLAGLGGGIELLSPVVPGEQLELAAELDSVDVDAVGYRGSAAVAGRPVIRLYDCVGPMMPLEEFDDPAAVRHRFARLCAGGAPCDFAGLPPLPVECIGAEAGQWVRATFQVPARAAFFADHFPRRPVFPGSLLMLANLELAALLADQLPPPEEGDDWALREIQDLKLRSFLAPGERLEFEARRKDCSPTGAAVALESRRGPRVIGSAVVRLTSARCS